MKLEEVLSHPAGKTLPLGVDDGTRHVAGVERPLESWEALKACSMASLVALRQTGAHHAFAAAELERMRHEGRLQVFPATYRIALDMRAAGAPESRVPDGEAP